ncbi:MAG: right-handed parallel beta-helix repeat-containing protein, partial [Phycisphaerales bacterium]
VEGNVVVNGAPERPVVFTAQDRSVPWGGLLFESSSSRGEFAGAILTGSGADSKWFNNNPGHGSSHRKDQCLFYLANGAHVTLTDCYLLDNHGQAGHGEDSYLTMTGCLVQKCTTVGQYNGGAVVFEDCALIEFPSATASYADGDNDAIYLTDGAHSLSDCLVGWALDDGVDAGASSGGSVTVTNCWFESCYHEGMAWSGPKTAGVYDTVILNCGQGIECGYDAPDVNAVHCLSTANLVGARFGDNYDWSYHGFLTVGNSLLLFNTRDVWGRAWDDWTVHLSQMDIQGNHLSAANANYPDNWIWDPQANLAHHDQLQPFLPTPADTVGIGLAALEDTFDLVDISNRIPVRLSTFTTNFVSVDYTMDADDRPYDGGSLQFTPGETVKHIQFEIPPTEDLKKLRVMLSNPVNAELTACRQITYVIPYEPVRALILEGDQWRYFKGVNEPPADWNRLSFNDTNDPAWLTGPTGIGYEGGKGYESCIATDLTDMQNNYISVYARRLFVVEDASRLTDLILAMDWDDGYIAYINGILVDSQNPPDPPAHNEPATESHEACCGTGTPSGPCPPEQIDLSDHLGDLVPGTNVLALQVHNRTLSSSDFIFIPELSVVVAPLPGDFEPDGDVDLDDFAVLATAWLAEDGEGRYNSDCDISIPPDGSIDLLDLLVFIDNWLAGL